MWQSSKGDLYEWLDVLEDIVNVVDGETKGLGDLELGQVVVLGPCDSLHHLVRVEDCYLTHVLESN